MHSQQKLKPDLEVKRVLEQYSLRSRKDDKKKEEIYSEKKTFVAVKPIEKVPTKTKELEFGGRIGMCANCRRSWKLVLFCGFLLTILSCQELLFGPWLQNSE